MWLCVIACAVTLAAGYALKAQCLVDFEGRSAERLCYNDIQALYDVRDIDTHAFPYINGYLSGTLKGGALEYPVLTGVFMWGTGLLVDNAPDYLRVSALFLAPFGLLAAFLLARMVGRRALMWAAAPAIVLYAFHNWDLLVVAAVVAGVYLWWRGHPVGAAIAFGVGAALKWYPGFMILPLVFEQYRAGRRRTAMWVAGSGFGTVILINLPFAYINPPSWWLTYRFHRLRGPNIDSIWGQAFVDVSSETLNLISTSLIVFSFVGILWWAWKRGSRDGEYPTLQACGALLAAFLMWNKVQSPQYTLWLLPFFVVLDVRLRWWIAYTIVDLAAYIGVFRFFYDLSTGAELTPAKFVMVYAVVTRTVLLGALVFVFIRARLPDPLARSKGTPSQFVSQPPSIVTASEI